MNTEALLRIVVIAATLLVRIPVIPAPVNGILHLDGILILRGERDVAARVVIFPLDAPASVLENVSGHFTLDLRLDNAYLLSFEGAGMVTKQVYFDTRIPVDELSRAFEFPFEVTLFAEGWNDIHAFAGPVGYVFYVVEKGDFVHRTDYSLRPGSREEHDLRELVARRSESAARSGATAALVMEEIHWAGHGRRGEMFVGKSYARDGHLQAEGRFLDARLQVMDGPFVFYYPNGVVESRGEFDQGRKTGLWERFDPLGNPLAERVYDPEVMDRIRGTMAITLAAAGNSSDVQMDMHTFRTGTPGSAVPENVPAGDPKPAEASQKTGTVPVDDAAGSDARSEPVTSSGITHKRVGSHDPFPELGTITFLGRSKVIAVGGDVAFEAGTESWNEELIVERMRVIRVVRVTLLSGHVSEYRRVTDRYGTVLYFKDGLNIPGTVFHAATGLK